MVRRYRRSRLVQALANMVHGALTGGSVCHEVRRQGTNPSLTHIDFYDGVMIKHHVIATLAIFGKQTACSVHFSSSDSLARSQGFDTWLGLAFPPVGLILFLVAYKVGPFASRRSVCVH
jgi:hypothetical protein